MPRDSAGVMTLPPTTWATTGQTISVNQHNPAMREIESALTDSLPRNGSAGMTGDLNLNGFRVTNVANPVNDGDAVSLGFARSATPVGMVMDYAGDFAPEGWILCDGRSLSRTAEASLFAVIGTKFGSSSGSTFNVPDLRGRIVAGADNMGGASANRITNAVSGFNPNTIGSAGGSQNHTLTVNEMPSHDHGGTTGSAGAFNPANGIYDKLLHVDGKRTVPPGADDTPHQPNLETAGTIRPTPNHTHKIPSQGGGQPHTNMQPTMVMNKIIRAR